MLYYKVYKSALLIYNYLLYYISKFLAYPLFVKRRYQASITQLQIISFLAYVMSNKVCIGIEVESIKDLMLQSRIITIINIVLLFLKGQTSILVNRLTSMPLNTYYIAHHQIRRVAIVQGILYAILALVSSKIVNMQVVLSIVVGTFYTFKARR